MKKLETIQAIVDEKVMAVIRAKTAGEAERLAEAAYEGGIRLIEMTLTTPGALAIVERWKKQSNVWIGAGTVADEVTARLAIESGADFIVSPYFDEKIVKLCNLYQVPIIPGASQPHEIAEALKLGCAILKLFPAQMWAPKAIHALKGPFPQAEFLPTGGITIDSIIDWLNAGAIAVGVGSEMAREAIRTGDYRKAADYARRLIEKVAEWKQCAVS